MSTGATVVERYPGAVELGPVERGVGEAEHGPFGEARHLLAAGVELVRDPRLPRDEETSGRDVVVVDDERLRSLVERVGDRRAGRALVQDPRALVGRAARGRRARDDEGGGAPRR